MKGIYRNFYGNATLIDSEQNISFDLDTQEHIPSSAVFVGLNGNVVRIRDAEPGDYPC